MDIIDFLKTLDGMNDENKFISLQSMLDANYASDKEWARQIVSIANSSARVLEM